MCFCTTLQLLPKAAAEMTTGEMLKSVEFDLFHGMSALGLMNPKLDAAMHRVPRRSIADRIADGMAV